MGFAAGTRVGDYEVVGTLGYGGMGEVYRVRHTISQRMEAMKLLRAGLPASRNANETLDRFTREIRLLATLNHPHIAALHTAFRYTAPGLSGQDQEPQLVMIMECVEGEDLSRRMHSGVTLEESLRYTRQVLSALSYAHRRGVVHRDIKPSNIMVTPEGDAKLLDFGLALGGLSLGGDGDSDSTFSEQRLTTTGALVGSMHYIAPEHIAGEPHDARSDIYATGVTLYEMITGRLPIEGASHLQVIAGHLQHAPKAPNSVNPKIPPGLSAAVLRALAKDPRERWHTADEFLAALGADGLHTLAGEDVSQVRVHTATARGSGSHPYGSPLPGSPQPGLSQLGSQQPGSPLPTRPKAHGSSGAHRPESLSEITRQLATHVGPIASVLVRRASSCSGTLRELVDSVAQEIESPAARQAFLAAVQKQLRG